MHAWIIQLYPWDHGLMDLDTSHVLEIFIDNKIDVKILSYLMHNGVVYINIYVWISHLIVI